MFAVSSERGVSEPETIAMTASTAAAIPSTASTFVAASLPGEPRPHVNEPSSMIAPAAQRWLPPMSQTFQP